jgi:hypothetical protein
MAIEFVGGNTAGKAGGTSGTSTIALDAGLTGGIASAVAAGDLVIAVFATGSTANRTLSITDGSTEYTLIDAEQYGADIFDTNLRVAYKFMGGTPDTATTFGPTGNAADSGAMAVYVFRGVDSSTPLDVAAVPATGTGTSRVVPPDITPSTAGAFVVVAGSAGHNGGVDTFTSSDLTDFRTQGGTNDTNDVTLGIGHQADWASGPTNYATWGHTQADSADFSWAAITLALRPASTVVEHATSGALTGAGSVVAGTAAHVAVHTSTGVLSGPGSTVAGSASSATARPSSGALTGPGSAVAGTAARTRAHATTGALAGQSSTVAGTAARTRQHATDGVLAGPGAVIAGDAARIGTPVSHATSGDLSGQGSTIAGAASSATTRAASGVLAGAGATVAGAAARTRVHATQGELAAAGAALDGAAARVGAPVEHATSGELVGPGEEIIGAAGRPAPADTSGAGVAVRKIPRLAVHHSCTGRLRGRGAKVGGAVHVTRTGQNPLALLMIQP